MRRQLRLLRYLGPHWRALGFMLALLLVQIGLDLLRPWPLKILLDDVLEQGQVPAALQPVVDFLPGPAGMEGVLLWVCIGTVLIVFARTLTDMAYSLVSVTFGQRMVYDLAADLFRHLQRLSLLFHSRQPVGDTVSRVNTDTYCLQTLVNTALLPFLQSVLELAAMFIVMWHIQPTLTLLSLGVVPLLMLCMWVFGGPMQERGRKERDLEGRLMSVVEQALNAIPAVQAFAREEAEHERFRRYAAQAVAAHRQSTQVDMWFKLFIGVLTAAGTAVIMWLGGRYALQGKVTVGTIIVFLSYLESLYAPLNAIVYTGSLMQHAAGSANRILEILDTPLDVVEKPGAQALPLVGHIRYENVTFGYEPGQPVLKGISLEAQPGEVVAIVGPSGGGKTTLVNLLVRFYDPWSGRITIDGQDVRALQLRSLREQVALVLHEPFLFPVSVAENIAYGRPAATRQQVVAAAVAASADEFIRRLPEGFDTIVGERGTTLSGGEKQRLAIARAFLKDAPILILDEPTSALDARTEGQLLDVLDYLVKNRTTFIIAHRLSTIRSADRILVVDRGRIVEQGRHEELLRQEGLYASLYHQQMDFLRQDVQLEQAPEHV